MFKKKVNTIHSNFRVIRTIINNAIDEDYMKREKNPFYKFKMRTETTEKHYLTEGEIKQIEQLKLEKETKLFHHRNMYIFACYAGGLRISDILQLTWNNFNGTHITVNTKKTNTTVSIKLPTKALEILAHYKKITFHKDNTEKFIFPILKDEFPLFSSEAKHLAIASATALLNKNLKNIALKAKINKKISFHSSRHTFATQALKKGIRLEYVGKLMGHSKLQQTQVYAKIVNEELDKAMDVFNAEFKPLMQLLG